MTTKTSKTSLKKISKSTRFEDALSELESIVQTLETGDQPLDKSLEQFERGIVLARFCQQNLQEAEQKVQILLKSENGDSVDTPNDDTNEALSDFDIPS